MVFGLFGSGGFAREVMPMARQSLSASGKMSQTLSDQIYFVDAEPEKNEINGYRVASEEDFFSLKADELHFNIAVGDSKLREKIAKACLQRSAKPLTLRSPQAVVYDENEIGEGAILCAHTTITSNAKIGRFFHANLYSYVAHDCVIGDFVTFAPNVHCNGNVHICDHAYIGTGAILKQGTSAKPLVIGEGAVVGMGAVVTKDVAPFTTVVGNPAKPFTKAKFYL
jgi:sugar O-acyltransferase (sialic acid O-acetyltransferase NeuD family)